LFLDRVEGVAMTHTGGDLRLEVLERGHRAHLASLCRDRTAGRNSTLHSWVLTDYPAPPLPKPVGVPSAHVSIGTSVELERGHRRRVRSSVGSALALRPEYS